MKRALSVILSLLLLVSVTPVAFATGDGGDMDWASLKEAMKAGGEITLQNDVAAPEGAAALSVPKDKTVTLDLNGHTVDRGLDSAKKKGCVIEVLGDLTVTDTSAEQTGAITGNAAKNGGGLAMDNAGSAEVLGGAISNNTATNNGGGVWFGRGTSFTLAGGSVTGNTAANQGGVYINDGAFDYAGGSVADNQQAAGGDIAAKSGSYLPTFPVTVAIIVDDSGNEGGAVTADKETAAEGETVTLTAAPDTVHDYQLKSLTVTAGGTEIPTTAGADGTYTFTMPAADVTLSAEFEKGSTWSDLASLLLAGGEIALTADYTASGEDDNLYIPEGVSVTLDLNGHTVDGSALPGSVADALIIDGALELGDSAGGGKLIRQGADDVVYVRWGSFVMTGGTIEAAVSECGGVYVNEDCSFLLTDGTLIADDCYACVYNNGSFDMRGGVLTGNVWEAMAYNRNSIMFMSGGSIEGSAGADYCYGYGVYLIGSNLFLSGAADIDVIENQFEDDPETNVDLHDYDLGVSYGMIYVVGALDPDGPVLGVDSHYYLFAEGDAAEEGGEVYTLTQSDLGRFKSADPAYGIRLTGDNTLVLTPCYSVTVADDMTNGTVTASPTTAIPGTSVALTVTPDEDYAVDTVTVNGTEIEPVDGAYGFEMPAEDVTVSAAFVLSVSPDQAAANQVIRKIDAIGEVAYTQACKAKIDEASDAYEALTDAQKELVTNAQALTDAVDRYNELKAQAETPTDPTDPSEPENPTEPTEPDTPSGSDNCPWDDVDHGTSFWGRLVRFFHTVLYFFAHLFGVR